MSLKEVNLAETSKLLTHLVDSVTCLECCKYYIVPERATCGHNLCHSCWRGRRACPLCAASLNRRALRIDIQCQKLTDHVQQVVESFEQLFGMKMEEFMMDTPLEENRPQDPSKNVKEWLTSSDNHFSAPPYSDTQTSTPAVNPQQILLSTSKIQIHNPENSKSSSPQKVAHVQTPQDDWDKIEVVPDTEDVCGKKNASIAGPMDLEPFYVDDNEYTNENPRRSSRKRENDSSKGNDSTNKHTDKQSSHNSYAENDKKLDKAKQNWAQVKKMKKEFSKLNKVNKNKLNVSIEMCKKTQSGHSKQNSATPPAANVAELVIDENTPDILALQQKDEQAMFSNKENVKYNSQKERNVRKRKVDDFSDSFDIDKMATDNDNFESRKETQKDQGDTEQIPNTFTEEETEFQLSKPKQTKEKTTDDILFKKNLNETAIKIPFFKKAPMQEPKKAELATKDDNNINIHSNSKALDDDIHIAIRIGDVITNITINKKHNDIQLKVNTDQEVQTSINSTITQCKNTNIVRPETKDMEVQTDVEDIKVINSVTQIITKNTPAALDKSVSTKKNTDSAVTATAQYEITESVEKELSKIMECPQEVGKQVGDTQISSKSDKNEKQTKIKKKTQTPIKSRKNSKNTAKSQTTEKTIPEDLEEVEELEDVDLFNSGSVKEQNVQLLKNTPSEILPTYKTHKKTQKTNEKRIRELDEEDIEGTNKRLKSDTQITRNDQINDSIALENKAIDENESTNYDEVMAQVFPSIDADIQESQVQKSLQTKDQTQVLHKETQKVIGEKEVMESQTVKKAMTEKYSENMFSTVGNLLEKGNTHIPGPETQQHIENLLTPGMCEDLTSTQDAPKEDGRKEYGRIEDGRKEDGREQDGHKEDGCKEDGRIEDGRKEDGRMEDELIVLGTPMEEDDSDKSVVEETPQKNKPSSATKSRTDSAHRTVVTTKSLQLLKPTSNVDEKTLTSTNIPQKDNHLQSQDKGTVIDLTDTMRQSTNNKGKDSAVPSPKKTLETPLNINLFVDRIKHNSTPLARKSLNFTKDSNVEDDDVTCPTNVEVAKTTQEKEFMTEAFENRPNTQVVKPVNAPTDLVDKLPFCIAGSCLTAAELTNLKVLCFKRKWTFTPKYTHDLTHLVVSVDENFRAQRSVKYMCALAAGKWIVAYDWVKQCLQTNTVHDELPFEARDSTGEPGPHRSRVASTKIFTGITFYCMPPFSVLDAETLENMLTAAGGRVVHKVAQARVVPNVPSFLLAEPELTQEDRFLYLALEHSIVPVNSEWALNCLGSYTLFSAHDLLLCPAAMLPKAVKYWPGDLLTPVDY